MSSTLKVLELGNVGVEPRILFLNTDALEADVFAPGYINAVAASSGIQVYKGDFVLIKYDEGTKQEMAIPEVGVDGIITLLPVAGDFNTGGPIDGGQNVGGGEEVFKDVVANLMRFRTLIAGDNITLTQNADDITIAAADPGEGTITDGANLGTGNGVFAQASGSDLQFKSLVAGANITLTPGLNDITIAGSGSGGGVINDGENLGTGNGVYSGVSGDTLQFKSLKSGDNVTIIPDSTSLTVSFSGTGSGDISGGTNLGSGQHVFAQKVAPNLQFKTLVAGPNINLSSDANTVTITGVGGGGSGFVFQNTLFVAKGGSDANDGKSIDNPKLTIDGAITAISPSTTPTTINILDNGTYLEHTALSANQKVRIIGPAAIIGPLDAGQQAITVLGTGADLYLNVRQLSTIGAPATDRILYAGDSCFIELNLQLLQGGVNTAISNTGCSISGYVNTINGNFGDSGHEYTGSLDLLFNEWTGNISAKNANVKLVGNAFIGNIGLIGLSTNSAFLTGFVTSVSNGFTITATDEPNAYYSGIFGTQLYNMDTFNGTNVSMTDHAFTRLVEDIVTVTSNFTPGPTKSNTMYLFDDNANATCTLTKYEDNDTFPIGYTVYVCQRQAGNVHFLSGDPIESVNGKNWTEGRGSIVKAMIMDIYVDPIDPLITRYGWSLSGMIAGSATTSDSAAVYVSALTGDDTTGIGSPTQPFATFGAAIAAIGTPTVATEIIGLDGETYTETLTIAHPLINISAPEATLTRTTGPTALTVTTNGTQHLIEFGLISASGGGSAIANTGTSTVVVNAVGVSGPVTTVNGGIFIRAATIVSNFTESGSGSIRYVSAFRSGTNSGSIVGISPQGVTGSTTFGLGAYTVPLTDGTAGYVMTTDGAGVASWQAGGGGGGLAKVGIAGTTQAAAVDTIYVNQNAGFTTITLPATFGVGDIVQVNGLGAGGWTVVANTGDVIRFFGVASSAGGAIASTQQDDSVQLVGVIANDTWSVAWSGGSTLSIS